MKAMRSISIGLLAVSLGSACSSSSPRVSPMQQGLSGNQIGATNSKAESSNHLGDSATVSATTGAQLDPKASGTLALARAADVDRSQSDVDIAMRKRGYTLASNRGERVYCRSEALTGSNLESKVCLTARQIEDQERAGKAILNGNRPAGCSPKTGNTGCN
jgi:hypothetical protein